MNSSNYKQSLFDHSHPSVRESAMLDSKKFTSQNIFLHPLFVVLSQLPYQGTLANQDSDENEKVSKQKV